MTETKKSICNMLSGLILQVVTMMVGLIIPRLVLVHYGSETNGLLNSITQIFNYVALLEAGVGIVSTQVLYERLAKHDYSGISSCLSATVHYYLGILADRGLIEMKKYSCRAIKLVGYHLEKDKD